MRCFFIYMIWTGIGAVFICAFICFVLLIFFQKIDENKVKKTYLCALHQKYCAHQLTN
jgi:hypothetical protein